MVANLSLDSGAVSLLAAYTQSQQQMTKVQDAVSTGYDVNKAADNPLFFMQAQSMRGQANAYTSTISRLGQYKSGMDRLSSSLQTITDTANKVRDTITSLSGAATGAELTTAATNITSYLKTIENVINGANDGHGLGFIYGGVNIDTGPANPGDFKVNNPNASFQGLQFNDTYLGLDQVLTKAANLAPGGAAGKAGWVSLTYTAPGQTATAYVADLSTATNRAAFLGTVSNWIDNTLSNASSNIGAFSNALDSQIQSMHTNQDSLNAEADALTKTDLTKDSAQSTALSTQQQLLTSLLSMSNQRMSSVLSLFR
eukprot:gene16081-16254_t